MIVEKAGISRNIDEAQLAYYRAKGYRQKEIAKPVKKAEKSVRNKEETKE